MSTFDHLLFAAMQTEFNKPRPSVEIAQAMMARAGINTTPFAVPLPPVVCPKCGGCGCVDISPLPYDEKLVPCRRCMGVGEIIRKCELCNADATALDDGNPVCDAHLMSENDVVTFALRHLP